MEKSHTHVLTPHPVQVLRRFLSKAAHNTATDVSPRLCPHNVQSSNASAPRPNRWRSLIFWPPICVVTLSLQTDPKWSLSPLTQPQITCAHAPIHTPACTHVRTAQLFELQHYKPFHRFKGQIDDIYAAFKRYNPIARDSQRTLSLSLPLSLSSVVRCTWSF
jgi:hypothetical protein